VPSPFDQGDLGIADNVVLLGAPTMTALEAATKAYPTIVSGGTPPNVYLTFLGRALAAPEISVFLKLGGNPPSAEWLPLGTTLANVVERFVQLPIDPNLPPALFGGINRPSSLAPSGQLTARVGLIYQDGTAQLTVIPPGMFDLPFIAGDSLSLHLLGT